jgi:H3 lysine-79-specific histone-lysine N-methyltransferase
MGRNPLRIIDLHHSADNHEKCDLQIKLRYPSGGYERFTFGKRKSGRLTRYAHPLHPFHDLIQTIEVILDHNSRSRSRTGQTRITRAHLNNTIQLLRNFWEHPDRDDPAFQHHFKPIITTVSQICAQPLDTTLPFSPTFIEHFFTQLHDRSVCEIAQLLERSGEKTTESTYGELLPPFLSTLFLQTGLARPDIFLDLGSGVGQTVMQAALETGCEALGIEREPKTDAVAHTHLAQFEARTALWGLRHGPVHLKRGDFLDAPVVDEYLRWADVVLVNNLKLDPETDEALRGKLGAGLKVGARVISTRPVEWIGRAGRKRRRGDGEEPVLFRTEELEYPPGSVSWSAQAGKYYISTKL